MTGRPLSSAPSAAAAQAAAPARGLAGFFARIKPPYYFASLITFLLVIGEWKFQILGGYGRLALALGTAIAAEQVLSRLLRGRFVNPLSAYITGNSIVILTKPAPVLWPFALGALISIASKYALQLRGRHLWNPTNFGISAMLLLAPGSVAILSHEWGNAPAVVAIVWSIGFLVCWKASVFHVSVSYLATFLVLAPVRAWISGDPLVAEIAPITGPMYTLFMFFMITDPRTVVSSRRWRIAVAVLIGLAETLMRIANEFDWIPIEGVRSAPAMFALAIVGPIAMAIDLLRKPRAR